VEAFGRFGIERMARVDSFWKSAAEIVFE